MEESSAVGLDSFVRLVERSPGGEFSRTSPRKVPAYSASSKRGLDRNLKKRIHHEGHEEHEGRRRARQESRLLSCLFPLRDLRVLRG